MKLQKCDHNSSPFFCRFSKMVAELKERCHFWKMLSMHNQRWKWLSSDLALLFPSETSLLPTKIQVDDYNWADYGLVIQNFWARVSIIKFKEWVFEICIVDLKFLFYKGNSLTKQGSWSWPDCAVHSYFGMATLCSCSCTDLEKSMAIHASKMIFSWWLEV